MEQFRCLEPALRRDRRSRASPQAAHRPSSSGTPEHITLDLNALRAAGVEIVGRLGAIRDGRALFSGGLAQSVRARRPQDGTACSIRSTTGRATTRRTARLDPPSVSSPPAHRYLRACRSICAAAKSVRSSGPRGFVPTIAGWRCRSSDRKGLLRHDGGVVIGSPGLYAIGLPVLRRRKSTFILGAEDDARDLVAHLAGYLAGNRCSA